MDRTELGRTGIEISAWCLGTMTYGNQTPEEDAHRQIDMALDAGIDFLDTAEMYPVLPVTKETVGRSEEFIGTWIARTGRREDIVIATKACGPNPGWVRDGAGYDGANLAGAVDASLQRLQTDMIDLYQLHWPHRRHYHFRQNWDYDPSSHDAAAIRDHMDEVLGAMANIVASGKVRAFGLSNETAWGTTRWIDRAEVTGGPRVATVQNEYSLLARLYDTDLAEVGVAEDVTLLAFSPLATGLLTGKYRGGVVPKGSRLDIQPDLSGRQSDRAHAAVEAYAAIAERHGLDLLHLAMAFQTQRPFPNVPIFGATTAEQLQRILGGIGTRLSDEVLTQIGQAHRQHAMPY